MLTFKKDSDNRGRAEGIGGRVETVGDRVYHCCRCVVVRNEVWHGTKTGRGGSIALFC